MNTCIQEKNIDKIDKKLDSIENKIDALNQWKIKVVTGSSVIIALAIGVFEILKLLNP